MSYLGRKERAERRRYHDHVAEPRIEPEVIAPMPAPKIAMDDEDDIIHITRADIESRLKSGDVSIPDAIRQFPDILMGADDSIPSWGLSLIRRGSSSHSPGRYVFVGGDFGKMYHAASLYDGEDYLVTAVSVWRDLGRNRYFHDPIVTIQEINAVTSIVRKIDAALDGKLDSLPGYTSTSPDSSRMKMR